MTGSLVGQRMTASIHPPLDIEDKASDLRPINSSVSQAGSRQTGTPPNEVSAMRLVLVLPPTTTRTAVLVDHRLCPVATIRPSVSWKWSSMAATARIFPSNFLERGPTKLSRKSKV